MALEIRQVTPETLLELKRVWQIVYRRDDPIPEDENPLSEGEIGVLGSIDGVTVGGYSVERLDLSRGEGLLPCGGIAGVAVLPEHRQSGFAAQLMRHSLEHMRDQGYVVAALYAFRESYYRKFGYEVAGRRWEIKCPQSRFPNYRVEMPVRKLEASDVMLLDPAYRAFCRTISGGHLRNEEDWKHRLGKKAPMIYAVGDPVEAYFWTGMDGWFWEDLRLGEVAWANLKAYKSLMGVLHGLISNRTSLTWYEPSNGPFLHLHMDQGIAARVDRQVMFRCLDVPGALARLVPEDSGEFTVEIDDPFVPSNSRTWAVKFSPSGVEVAPTTDAAGIKLDIWAFSQALMGEPSLSDLLTMGRADCLRETDAKLACRLLTPSATVCSEFF